ncbi:hypothetical protein JL720_8943 [Aureococcus anophagefferens]|nr:hypothetical protein JL720_8943 [Aureococcus anophagefferens]
MSLSDNIKTTPPDKRFPTQNQANHCWNRAAAASDRLRRLSRTGFPPRPRKRPRPPRARRAARDLDARARAATGVDGERAGYNEWVLCLKKTDGDEDACKPMRQFALSICPDDWYNKWDEEREEGTFSGIKFSA